MIVRDTGEAWQIVLQTDHAELCGAFAAAWEERGPRHASLTLAARRHDDGWATWERSPLVGPEGKPVSFLEVAVPAHLAFYRAGIVSITDEDAYAGLLVSMHGAGIYRQRYGLDPGLKLTHADEVRPQVEAFVAEQEAAFPERREEAGVTEQEARADYRALQLLDRLSLHFCMRDVAAEAVGLDGVTISPRGGWRVRFDPCPFPAPLTRFTLRRRLVPKRAWTQQAFREWYRGQEAEDVSIEIEGGA